MNRKTQKYTLPEDDAPKMAGEPVAAYAIPQNQHQMYFEVTPNQTVTDEDDDVDWESIAFSNPKLQISDEELRRLGRECINAPRVSAEEAIKHFMSL